MKPFVFVFDFLDRALASSVFRVLARKIEILMQCQQMYLLRLHGMSNRFFFFFVICKALKKRLLMLLERFNPAGTNERIILTS
jgi:hypothetical protein